MMDSSRNTQGRLMIETSLYTWSMKSLKSIDRHKMQRCSSVHMGGPTSPRATVKKGWGKEAQPRSRLLETTAAREESAWWQMIQDTANICWLNLQRDWTTAPPQLGEGHTGFNSATPRSLHMQAWGGEDVRDETQQYRVTKEMTGSHR